MGPFYCDGLESKSLSRTSENKNVNNNYAQKYEILFHYSLAIKTNDVSKENIPCLNFKDRPPKKVIKTSSKMRELTSKINMGNMCKCCVVLII